MWFKRKYNEYGCPMCDRLPVLVEGQTDKYYETLKTVGTTTIYRLQCPQKTPLYKLVQRPYGCKHPVERTRGQIQGEGREKMKWKPDWLDIAKNLLIGLMAVAAAAIFIVFCVCIWEEVTTARTIIMRDGNQSYACTVSDISPAPHDCNPIEDTK